MGNAGLSREPPVDAPGTAVMYIRGFSYTAYKPCTCATPELLATTSGGCVSKLDTGSVPQELAGCAITPEEFADGCARVDGIAKHLVPAGSMVLRMIVLPMLMVLAGGALMGIGATICDDETPKDYWRDECVEMGENCATRSLPPLESLYPTCRAVCNATLSPGALAETTSPGCPAGDLGCPHEGGLAGLPCLPCPVGRVGEGDEPTRGCHCQPSSDVRRISCQIKKGKGRFVPGCREFEYTRVCDDVMHPLFLLGLVILVLGYIGIFGYWFYVICFKAPALVRQAMHLLRIILSLIDLKRIGAVFRTRSSRLCARR